MKAIDGSLDVIWTQAPRPTPDATSGVEEPSGTGRRWVAPPPATMALVICKQGASGPIMRAWRTPVVAAADRSEGAAGRIVFSSTDRGVEATGYIILSPAD